MDELNPQEEKNLKEAMRRSKMKEMLGGLKELEDTLPEVITDAPAKAVAKRRSIWPLAVAASLLFLLAAGWYLMRETPMTAGEQLFAQHFEAYPTIGITRGGVADLKTKAYEAYNGADYATAVDLFGQLNAKSTDTLSLFYMGISQIAAGEMKDGIKTLNQFKSISDLDGLVKKADWYILLGKVRAGDVGEDALLNWE